LPKVEHPKFEGHVTSNKDEYQKSVRLKFRYCLVVTVSLLITLYMHIGRVIIKYVSRQKYVLA